MRITILSGSVPTTTFIDGLINAMAEEGFAITVIGKKTGDYNYHKKVEVITVPDGIAERLLFIINLLVITGFKHIGKIISNSKGWKGMFNDFLFYLPIIHSKPDRIHLQWTAFIHDRDLLFELFPGKVLVSLRGAHINYTPLTTFEIRDSYLRLFSKVHRFHAVSEAIVTEAEQYGVKKSNTDVIYSFVNDALLEKRIESKPEKAELHIISVGRFFWKKGYEYALDALRLLKQIGVPFTYTLIAEGKTPASVIYHIHQCGLTNNVRIVNGTSHTEVLKAIERHDVLLLPSVEEGIANVVLEAMAVGTPVITTDVGGMKEVITHGHTGYIAKARDVQGIADSLIAFSNLDKNQRFAIAINAKEAIQKKHDKKMFTTLFAQFYKH